MTDIVSYVKSLRLLFLGGAVDITKLKNVLQRGVGELGLPLSYVFLFVIVLLGFSILFH